MFLVLGGTAGLVYQVLGPDEVRGAEVARAARLSASATSAALRVLAEHGLAERGPGGWRRGAVALADVAESTGAAGLQREREERYRQDRESWRARLREYQAARQVPVMAGDGWLGLDDEDEWAAMLLQPLAGAQTTSCAARRMVTDRLTAPPAAGRPGNAGVSAGAPFEPARSDAHGPRLLR